MNSCRSSALSACAPPLMTFIIGTGSTCADGPPSERQSGSPSAAAEALATASETPSTPLAPDAALVGRAVDLAEQAIDAALVVHVVADQRRAELAVHARNRARDRLAAVGGAAVAALDRLVRAGRGTRRHGGAAERAGVGDDVDLDGRVSARVEDLARVHGCDRCHLPSLRERLAA